MATNSSVLTEPKTFDPPQLKAKKSQASRTQESHRQSASHGMFQLYPASSWKEAFPMGNGQLGALVHGRIAREVITLNHEWLWGGAVMKELPDVSSHLPKVRKALDEGRYWEAEKALPGALREAGYAGARASAFMPGPDLVIRSLACSGFRDYKRRLDFSTAEASVEWASGNSLHRRRMFVSAIESVLVCDLQLPAPLAELHEISLTPHSMRDAFLQNLTLLPLEPTVRHVEFADGAGTEVDLGNGCRYAAAFQLRGVSGLAHRDGVLVCEFGPSTMLLCALSPMEGPQAASASELYEKLCAVEGDYEEIFKAHSQVHQIAMGGIGFNLGCDESEHNRSNEELLLEAYSGDLPDALAERLFHYGRYLLACSSRPGGLPAHLQGLWNGDYCPPWLCAYFNNENLQMSCWQALPGNLAGALLPVFDLYESRMEDFRTNARNLFGCRGILLPLYMSPENGLQKDLQSHVIYWTGAGAWLSQLYWEYWLFTRDRGFLEKRAIPFMREVALFYSDFLQGCVQHGKTVIYPGNSPENRALPHKTAVCVNATMDAALVRELVANLISGLEELGEDKSEFTDSLRSMAANLPVYEIGEDGALREWMHPEFQENHNHRHISHIYPFFPGHEFAPDPGDPWFQAVHRSIEKRMKIGIGDQTGWSLAHLANIYGRLGEGEKALECLAHLAQSCVGSSLFTYHNDVRGMGVTMDFFYGLGPALQLDAILGLPAAIMEMLLYSSPDTLRVLPSLPQGWKQGSICGLRTRCGIEVALGWDQSSGLVNVQLHAVRSASFRLYVGFAGDAVQQLSLSAGETRDFCVPFSTKGD
jgi:alpha-L-fucosidase 2